MEDLENKELPDTEKDKQEEPKKVKTETKEPSSRLKTQVEKIVKEVMKSWEEKPETGTVKVVELPKPKPQPKQETTLEEKLTEEQQPNKETLLTKIFKSIW